MHRLTFDFARIITVSLVVRCKMKYAVIFCVGRLQPAEITCILFILSGLKISSSFTSCTQRSSLLISFIGNYCWM